MTDRLGNHDFFLAAPLIRYLFFWVAIALAIGAGQAHGEAAAEGFDLTAMPLEQLLDLEVSTAAKFARHVSDAPSAVTVITAQDIHDYGYRTLGEVLNSVRGLFTFYDRAYESLAGRGYGNPGDFVGRIMILIDGYRANDSLYDSIFIGNDGMLDTSLIDRVEYISGPNATTYGNSAFFGIINIVTKKGGDFNGLQASAEYGSYRYTKERATYGNRFDNGAEILLSLSGHHSAGQTLFFPEFNAPSTNNGIARGLDAERNSRFFGKLEWQNWTLEAGHADTRKDLPAAPYGLDFNAKPAYYEDISSFASIKHNQDIARDLKLSLHGYYGDYIYHGGFVFGGQPWHESATGRWAGLDAKFAATWFDSHKLVFGAEYRADYERKQSTPAATSNPYLRTFSLYAQDEIALCDNLSLHLGGRYDDNNEYSGHLSPRAALIYLPQPATTLKLSYATGFRTPSAVEKYYDDGGSNLPNRSLHPERIRTTELVLEHRLDTSARLTASLYHYMTEDLITPVQVAPGVLQNFNLSGGHAVGAEFEFEKNFVSGIRLRTSYAYQYAEDGQDNWEANSPRHLGKLNLSTPWFGNRLRTGLEIDAMSKRKTMQDSVIGGHAVTNLTLTSDRLLPNLDASLSIRNLFDCDYSDVAPIQNVQPAIRQNSRNYWLQLNYNFR